MALSNYSYKKKKYPARQFRVLQVNNDRLQLRPIAKCPPDAQLQAKFRIFFIEMLASLNYDLFGFVFLSKLIERIWELSLFLRIWERHANNSENFSMNEYEDIAYVAFPSFIFCMHGKLLEVFSCKKACYL